MDLVEAGENLFSTAFSGGLGHTIRQFWHFFCLDLPRYAFTDVLLVGATAWRRWRPATTAGGPDPFGGRDPLVSVIVPVKDEAGSIYRSVESLHDQTYRQVEILFIDDGSQDETPEICKRLAARYPDVRHFRMAERGGKSAALNLGFRYSRGEVICFVDADTTFDRGAVAEIVRFLRDPTVGCVAGNVRVRNARENLLTELQNLEYGLAIAVGRRIRAGARILPIVSGAFGGFRRDAVAAVGGHDPGPGNDSDLTAKMRKLGYRVAFAPAAVCFTNVPTRVGPLARQRRRWARNVVKNRIFKHGDVFNPFHHNWKPLNALSSADSIFFNVALAFTSVTYLVDLVLNFPTMFPSILMANFVLYATAELFEVAVMLGYSERRTVDAWSFLYLPLYSPYKRMLKFVRAVGYLEELLFKRSALDPFAPEKVRRKMERW